MSSGEALQGEAAGCLWDLECVCMCLCGAQGHLLTVDIRDLWEGGSRLRWGLRDFQSFSKVQLQKGCHLPEGNSHFVYSLSYPLTICWAIR